MNIAILGAYQTCFGELWDKSLEDLIAQASWGALKDAQMPAKKIQMIYLGNKLGAETLGQSHLGSLVNELLGVQVPALRIEAACASGGVAVAQACLAIQSGAYDVVLALGAEKMTDLPPETITSALMEAASPQEREAGLGFSGLYALMASQYLKDFGARQEDLARISVKNHFHACLNPKAQFHCPITVENVMQSGMVAHPLKLLDCSPVSDGAAAVILASEKFAKKMRKNFVRISASSQACDSLSLTKRKSLTTVDSTVQSAQAAFAQAGLGPKEIDLAEVHDCFSIAEILALEDLGFYKKGEGFIVARNGELKLGGKRPINLSGGLKACGHPVGATGVKQIVELYNQLMGRGGKKQTKKAQTALSHNIGGTGGTAVVHILKK